MPEEEELVFPYSFANSDPNLLTPRMLGLEDSKSIERHNKVLAELTLLLEPDHESGLH